MKITVSLTIEVNPESYAECYGEEYNKKNHNQAIKDDAHYCVEQSLTDWFDRIGFEGKVVNPKFIDTRGV